MTEFRRFVHQLLTQDEGATAVEYALMVTLIALVIIVSVTTMGSNASTKLSAAAVGIANAS